MSIYLIQAGGTDRYKIGQSNDPAARLKELRKSSPVWLGLVGYCSILTETFWHWLFSNKVAHNEWFDLSQTDLVLFHRLEEIDTLLMQTSRTPGEIARLVASALSDFADSQEL